MSRRGPRLERLDTQHDLSAFDCGATELNRWLTRHALAAQQMDSARTFLLLDGERVVGYFSLTMGAVRRQDAPPQLVRGMPGYPLGMVLLARLAVERSHQQHGLGRLLLATALRRAAAAAEHAAARLVVVDALDARTAGFYKRHGFIETPEHPLRLYLRVRDIRASIDAADG